MSKKLITIAALMMPYCAVANNERIMDPIPVNSNIGDFYIKGSVGGLALNKFKIDYDDTTKITAKAKVTPFFIVGIGYHILNNVRADLTFEHYVDPTFKASKVTKRYDETLKLKGQLNALMLSGYIDLINNPKVPNIFVGGGVGVAQLKEKASAKTFDKKRGRTVELAETSTKTGYNFAYSLAAGVSLPITERLYTELVYSWKDFGKTKPRMNEDGERMSPKHAYRGHNISLGFRVLI